MSSVWTWHSYLEEKILICTVSVQFIQTATRVHAPSLSSSCTINETISNPKNFQMNYLPDEVIILLHISLQFMKLRHYAAWQEEERRLCLSTFIGSSSWVIQDFLQTRTSTQCCVICCQSKHPHWSVALSIYFLQHIQFNIFKYSKLIYERILNIQLSTVIALFKYPA